MQSAADVEVEAPRTKSRLLFALKVLITVGAFAFILARQPLGDFLGALSKISLISVLGAIALQLVALVIGTLRWRLLMHAYGASARPSFGSLFKVYCVGYFYNTYLPGGVGGDVMRGIVTRRAFGEQGATGAMAVVFVERALGLAGVMGLTAIAITVYASGRLGPRVVPYSLLGLAAIGVLLTAVALGRKLARFAPAAAARILGSLPTLDHAAPFIAACLLSLLTHALVALCGHTLMLSIYPQVALGDSFVAMPLAGAAGYFPLTIAGAGARDAALVELYGALGVPRAAGVATAVAFLFTSLITAGVGGLVQLLSPLTVDGGTQK